MAEKVIFWDFDGTLSYPNCRFSSALTLAAAEVGYGFDATASTFLENAYPWKSPFADHTAAVGEGWWQALFDKVDAFCRGAGVAEADLPRIREKCRRILCNIDNYSLYTDTLSTLDTCRQMGYTNILLTNNYPEITEVVAALGITPYLTDLVVSSHIGYDKPREELYRYAIYRAGNPSVCYMIGDNPTADIGGGRDAGMTTIYVHGGRLAEADFSVDHLAEIPAILV